jgi:hypothetical protein
VTGTPGMWRKSTYSGNEFECVEVALSPHLVRVRDSTDPTGPQITVSPAAWRAFVADVAAGRLAAPGAA